MLANASPMALKIFVMKNTLTWFWCGDILNDKSISRGYICISLIKVTSFASYIIDFYQINLFILLNKKMLKIFFTVNYLGLLFEYFKYIACKISFYGLNQAHKYNIVLHVHHFKVSFRF